MKITINDLSFQYSFYDKETALKSLYDFIEICRKIESGNFHNVEPKTYSKKIDPSIEIAPGQNLYKILQSFKTKEQRIYLLGLLTSRPTPKPISDTPFILDGKRSYVCAHACENMIVSLLSHSFFENETIQGFLASKEIEIKNLSKEQHIMIHRDVLGLRIYKANAVKHKRNKENAYGKGKIASIMDLTDAEGQELLDKAVCINGKLFGRKNGHNYAFQCEGDVSYHGYQVSDLSENILLELDKYKYKWN